MTAYCDTDRHEDPPVRVTDAARIELATERVIGLWLGGHEPQFTEAMDLDRLIKRIAFKSGQELAEGVHALEMALRDEAERIAKLRAEHPI